MAETVKTDTAPAAIKTVTLTIDGRTVTVPKGTTVLEASLGMGIHIPTFCWHPKLKPVGACRMCYVEIEKMPKLQVSCATEATEGMVVRTDSDQVKQGRKAVIEFLLINHPLDCPTCDKGGECDLQNLTFSHGYDDSRFEFFKKRRVDEDTKTTFDDKRIGPEIILNRNRCILCYKCVRSNKEAFGEYDLGAFERGNATEIDAAPGQQVNNPFSGNLVEICPVGALTNTDWRYKIRVWLTTTASAVDPFTSSGTNITFYKEDHKNQIFRSTSRRNDEIDDGWLPDVVRYGYQIAQATDRIKTPMVKKNGALVKATWEEALSTIAKRIDGISKSKGNVCIGGIAGPQLDAASLHSFNKLMRVVIGTNNVDFRTDYKALGTKTDSAYSILASQPFKTADIDSSDVIVVFGSDLIKEHPNEYLRIRKAYNFTHPRIYSINSFGVKSADIATMELIHKPGTEEAFINGLCLAAIEENVAVASDASSLAGQITPGSLADASVACGVAVPDLKSLAKAIAAGKKITFIAGEQVSRSRERDSISAALCNLNRLMGITQRGQMAVLAMYANSVGAEKLGLLPNPHPAVASELKSLWKELPSATGTATDAMIDTMVKGELDGLVVLGANPLMIHPDREHVKEALEKLDFLVVCDLVETETSAMADVVLPISSWAEYSGLYVNLEGRTQTSERGMKPLFESRPAHDAMSAIALAMGKKLFASDADRTTEIQKLLALNTSLPLPSGWQSARQAAVEADPAYPIQMVVGDDPHHRSYFTEKAASLAAFCSDAYAEISPELAESLDVQDGDALRIESKLGKMIAPARVSEHLEGNVVFVPRNFSASRVNALISRTARIDWVRLNKVSS
ncbi:MAG: NADH-quinone oxidoreductase subunit NuoG [Candidatus Zixiibacteriota bacterium]